MTMNSLTSKKRTNNGEVKTQSTRGKIVIAVDFGTTYSGIAWAWSEQPKDISIVNQWPDGKSTEKEDQESISSSKVPT